MPPQNTGLRWIQRSSRCLSAQEHTLPSCFCNTRHIPIQQNNCMIPGFAPHICPCTLACHLRHADTHHCEGKDIKGFNLKLYRILLTHKLGFEVTPSDSFFGLQFETLTNILIDHTPPECLNFASVLLTAYPMPLTTSLEAN